MRGMVVVLLVAGGCSGVEPRAVPHERAAAVPAPGPIAPHAPAPAPRRVTIAASGDVIFHLKVLEAAREHGLDHLFDGVREVLAPDEIAFANLESPLADDLAEMRTGTPPITGAPPEAAGALARAGLDVVGLANNHAYDQRSEGLLRTMAAVRETGMIPVGAAERPDEAHAHAVIERGGLRVAFLGATARVNQGAGENPPRAYLARIDEEALLQAAGRARADADVVVLAVHWSGDFRERPLPDQRELARRLVDGGVDVILGTGPHILQEVERLRSPRGDAVVAYSLGNLLSNQGLRFVLGSPPRHGPFRPMFDPMSRDAVFLRIALAVEDGRVTIESLRAEPLWTENNFLARHAGEAPVLDIQVLRLAAIEERLRDDRLPAIRLALGDAVQVAL